MFIVAVPFKIQNKYDFQDSVSRLGVERVENLSNRVELTDFRIESNSTSMVEISNRVEFRVPIFGQFFDDF